MKLQIFLALFAFSMMRQATVQEPETANVFYRLDSGKLVQLERQTATVRAKASSFIVVTNAKAFYEISGGKSTVRFKSGEPIEFVVRSPLAASTADPGTFYCLRRLESKRKSRDFLANTIHAIASPIGASATLDTRMDESLVPLTFSRYGSSSFLAKAETLPSGEYALQYRGVWNVFFCFGVDK
jgi:hypothetical protein